MYDSGEETLDDDLNETSSTISSTSSERKFKIVPEDAGEPTLSRSPYQVPTLVSMALNKLSQDPASILKLYGQMIPGTQPSIKELLDPIIKREEAQYAKELRQRQRIVNQRTKALQQNGFFNRCFAMGTMSLTTGLHVGIYYLLQAADVDPEISLGFLASIPVSMCAGICLGVFSVSAVTRPLANCCTAQVADEREIDLHEIVVNLEARP